MLSNKISIDILFILVLEEQFPKKDFSLKNLRGSSKIDVAARAILSVFPNQFSELNPKLHILFTKNDPHILEIIDIPHRTEKYDEIEIASFIRSKLNDDQLPGGIKLKTKKINDIKFYIKQQIKKYNIIQYLHEDGYVLSNLFESQKNAQSYCFLLGGRQDISLENEEIILSLEIPKLSLGKRSYLASTCITKLQYEISKSLII